MWSHFFKKRFLLPALGLPLAAFWFAFSIHVTANQPVRSCCDSANYIAISNTIDSFGSVIHFVGDRTVGYPAFLALSRGVTHLFPVFGPDWILASEIFSLLLFWVSISFVLIQLSNSFVISPYIWLFCLCLIGVVGAAAVPLSDVISLDFLILAFGCVIAESDGVRLKDYVFAFFGGLFFGVVIQFRPLLLLSVLPILALIIVCRLKRCFSATPLARRHLYLAGLLVVGFISILSPQLFRCTRLYGNVCIQTPQYVSGAASSIQIGLKSPRITGTFTPPTQLFYIDPFMDRHFGNITIDPNHAGLSFLKSMLGKFFYVPLYFLKKIVGIFDAVDINGFGAGVTPLWAQRLMQIFGGAGFVGFFVGIPFLFLDLLKRNDLKEKKLEIITKGLPFIFAAIYIITLSPFHVESRYVFPAYPFCIIAFFLSVKPSRVPIYLTACIVFIIQIYLWRSLVPISIT
jgi:hypothetical protein